MALTTAKPRQARLAKKQPPATLHPLSQTLQIKWETILWLEAEKRHKKKTPGITTSFAHDKGGKFSKCPPAPAVLSKNSGKSRFKKNTQAPTTDVPEEVRTHQQCGTAAWGTTAGLQATELTTGQLLGMEEVPEVVFAAQNEFTSAIARFFHRRFSSKQAVIIAAQ